jgi:hypothetical protein
LRGQRHPVKDTPESPGLKPRFLVCRLPRAKARCYSG